MSSWFGASEALQITRFTVANLFFGVFLCANVAITTPTVTFPINSQVPPVARVSEPFKFTFSASTFSSDSILRYDLSNAPNWLSLDGPMRTLSGIAPVSAANTAPVIQITASDDTGFVTTNATLVVSESPAPVIAIPLEDQLDTFGTTSSPSSILYYPSTPFNFSFSLGTFSQRNLNYYAVTLDNTPLPGWIGFDKTSLSFSGETPASSSLVQPPQTWGLQLIGSDVLGFAGTAIGFNITVGNHKLNFREEFRTINASIGVPIKVTNLTGSLGLDGNPASMSDIVSLNAETPDWLIFDNSTFEFNGIPPPGAKSSEVTLTAVDVYGDTASTLLHVDIFLSIFNGTIEPLNVTAGTVFAHDFSASFMNATDVEASIQIAPASPWISFDSQSLILSGKAPLSDQGSEILLDLQATSKSSGASDSQTFKLDVVSPHQGSSPSTVTVTSTETAKPGAPCTDCAQGLPSANKTLGGGAIAAIVLPVALVVVVGLILCFCCYRRRRQHLRRKGSGLQKTEISHPFGKSSPMVDQGEIRSPVDSSNRHSNTRFNSDRHTAALRRHSQALSTLVGGISLNLRDSRSSTIRTRSYSENALSDFGNVRRYTQDSTYPPVPVNTAQRSATRNTRNFSRKTGAPLSLTQRSSQDVLSSRMSEQTSAASRSSLQRTPDLAHNNENIYHRRISRRRTPSYHIIPNISQRINRLGHESQNSTADFSFTGEIRGRGGLGPTRSAFNFTSQHHALQRDDESWQTIESVDTRQPPRQSAISALTESTEVLSSPKKMTLRQVPDSPVQQPTAQMPMGSVFSRAVSNKIAGSSPFFAGSSRTASRGTSKKSRKSMRLNYRHSRSPPPTSDGEASGGPERPDMVGLRSRRHDSSDSVIEPADDSFGIIYGTPREGTRQLRKFVNQLGNRVGQSLRNSLQFSDSDNRFRSTEPTPGPSHYRNAHDRDQVLDHEHDRYDYISYRDGFQDDSNEGQCEVQETPHHVAQAIGTRVVSLSGIPSPSSRIPIAERLNVTEEAVAGAGAPSPARSVRPVSQPYYSKTSEHGDIVEDEAEDSDTHGAFL